MAGRFDIKRLLRDRDALVARLELAFALERRQKLVVPPEPRQGEKKDPERR